MLIKEQKKKIAGEREIEGTRFNQNTELTMVHV